MRHETHSIEEYREILYKDAIHRWGEEAQIDMAVEECAELIDKLQKNKRRRATWEDIAGEVADVSIMMEQMSIIIEELLDRDAVADLRVAKLERLKERLDKYKNLD